MTPAFLVSVIVVGLALAVVAVYFWSNISSQELLPPEPGEVVRGENVNNDNDEGRFRQLLDEERANFLSLVRKNWEDEKMHLEKLFNDKDEKINYESIGKIVEEKISQVIQLKIGKVIGDTTTKVLEEKMEKIVDAEKIGKIVEGKIAKGNDVEQFGKIIENKIVKVESKLALTEEKLLTQLDKLSARFEETLKTIRMEMEKVHHLSVDIFKTAEKSKLQEKTMLDELVQKMETAVTGSGKTDAQSQDELEFFFSRLNDKIANLQKSITELAGNR